MGKPINQALKKPMAQVHAKSFRNLSKTGILLLINIYQIFKVSVTITPVE
jgi:hypothetical protein